MKKTIEELLAREPFAAFRIVMNSGDRIDVDTSDMVVMGRDQLTYYYPNSNAVAFVRLTEIAFVRVENLLV